MEQSPYLKYDDILLRGKYGTAYRIQELVIALYDPDRFRFRKENYWGGFDTRHRGIYLELENWYREQGYEPSLVAVCEAIIALNEQQAVHSLAELIQLRATLPRDYPAEAGGTSEASYEAALEACEHHVSVARRKGFLRD
ncbi:hypothetical protein [Pseudomonas fluorescens]|uniref:hypothetical protein n=1 Tax=Pseudomonas fluorescens TaxID=294 RepID=UPI001BE86099|nr:hypothetical protein [Pseudomonas fluorescens]MBT2374388.1 hypothetical protein [Pseudomonas fluorescens]